MDRELIGVLSVVISTEKAKRLVTSCRCRKSLNVEAIEGLIKLRIHIGTRSWGSKSHDFVLAQIFDTRASCRIVKIRFGFRCEAVF